MILDGEGHTSASPMKCKDRDGQENEWNSPVTTVNPKCLWMIIPGDQAVVNSGHSRDHMMSRLPSSSYQAVLDTDDSVGFCRKQQWRLMEVDDQRENSGQFHQNRCHGDCRRSSLDYEVCELFEGQVLDLGTTLCECPKLCFQELNGFQRMQKGFRCEDRSSPLLSSSTGSGRRLRTRLRDLNVSTETVAPSVIQRPSLDFDKMQKYCLTRVHHGRVGKPKVTKVKSSYALCSPRCLQNDVLDPSIFSFRSISQNMNHCDEK